MSASQNLDTVATWAPTEVSRDDLFRLLSLDDDGIRRIINNATAPTGNPADVLRISTCRHCSNHLIIVRNRFRRESPWKGFNEFPAERTRCCDEPICKTCVLQMARNQYRRYHVENHWTRVDNEELRFVCPLACERNKDGGKRAYRLETINRILDDETGHADVRAYAERYERIELIRDAIKTIQPALTTEEIAETRHVYRVLLNAGIIWDPSTQDLSISTLDRYMRIGNGTEPFKVYKFQRNGNLRRVPIFERYFKRETTICCMVCLEDIEDIHVGDDWRAWMQIWKDLGNDLIAFKILKFPQRLKKYCGHEINFCRTCLEGHIRVRMRDQAAGAAGNVECLGQDCDRKLRLSEIDLYGPKDTKDGYRDLMSVSRESDHPNFMWCVSGTCQHGEIHPRGSEKVRCSRCGQAMCFRHRGPWHHKQTCENYERGIDNRSEAWIRENTRPCPRCGQAVQKDGGCYHMYCMTCRYEYCWDCGAEWRRVVRDLSAHEPTCLFRRNNVDPQIVRGDGNVQEAINNLDDRFRGVMLEDVAANPGYYYR